MLIVKSVEQLRNEGYSFDSYDESLIAEALSNNLVVYLNNRKQLIAKNDDTGEEKLLMLFA